VIIGPQKYRDIILSKHSPLPAKSGIAKKANVVIFCGKSFFIQSETANIITNCLAKMFSKS
jgi:hypothetical protein